MKQLVELSSTHRQTIHSYLRAGVLPAPLEGAGTRNARYGPRHVALLRLIRDFRDGGMSLAAIRRGFERAAFDPAKVRMGAESADLTLHEGETADMSALASEAGCDPAWIETLIKARVLDEGPLDRRLSHAIAASHALVASGLAEGTVLRIGRLAQTIAALESSALVSSVVHDTEPMTVTLARATKRHAYVSELVARLRSEGVRRAMRRMTQVELRSRTFARDAIHIPSQLFVRRYGLDEVIPRLEQMALQDNASAEVRKRLGQVLLGLGRYDEAVLWLERSERDDPNDPATHSYLGLAKAISERHSEAGESRGIDSARRAVALAPSSPRAHAFLAVTLALSATTTTDAESLRIAVHTAAESRKLAPPDLGERMETLLARGRLLTVLPHDLPEHRAGVEDLEEVLERTAKGEIGFALHGSTELYRIHALYYLGLGAYEAGQLERASEFLAECITIDPASRFARRAYEILGQSK